MHALDMIVNKRIYLATLDTMNDPDEGDFEIEGQIGLMQTHGLSFLNEMKALRTEINKTRFTSFTTKVDNPLLWAHYAGGYSGVAFEYDIPESNSAIDLLPIQYSGTPRITHGTCKKILDKRDLLYKHGILRSKRSEWMYENEYRLYLKGNNDSYLEQIDPVSIIVGGRNRRYDSVFEQICKKFKIRIGLLVNRSSGYEIAY